MRGYVRRRPRRPELPTLTPEERRTLAGLLDSVPDDARESDAAFLALLEHWWGLPYDVRPRAPAYKAKGAWLTAGVGQVLDAIRGEL